MISIIEQDKKLNPIQKKLAIIAIKLVLANYKIAITLISCSDKYIKKINKEQLNHDYETDIITFQYDDHKEKIEAELLISLDTVYANSIIYKTSLDKEFIRVVIHGCLHTIGYYDKTKTEIKEMRKAEEKYLNIMFPVEL